MPTYKLTYFDLRGRGETVRLVFAAAGVKYEETRISLVDWPGDHKAASPFGQLPYLEIDGKKYAQSFAISRYLAREHGLYGDNSLESLAIDVIMDLGGDYLLKCLTAFFHVDESIKKDLHKKLQDEDLPHILGSLEKLLKENGSEYYVGEKLSLADLSVYDVLENSYRYTPEVYSKYTRVLENRKLIRSKLDAYLSQRKTTDI